MNTNDLKQRIDRVITKRPSRLMENAQQDASDEIWLDCSYGITQRILCFLYE